MLAYLLHKKSRCFFLLPCPKWIIFYFSLYFHSRQYALSVGIRTLFPLVHFFLHRFQATIYPEMCPFIENQDDNGVSYNANRQQCRQQCIQQWRELARTCTLPISSVERQKGLNASHLHIQLHSFVSELIIYFIHESALWLGGIPRMCRYTLFIYTLMYISVREMAWMVFEATVLYCT